MGCVFFFIDTNNMEAGCDPHKEILEDIQVAEHQYVMHAKIVEELNSQLRLYAEANNVTIAYYHRHVVPDYNSLFPANVPKFIDVASSAVMSDGSTHEVKNTYFITKKPTV